MGHIKSMLYDGGTDHLSFLSGLKLRALVNVCDLYKKQYTETSEVSFDKKHSAMFNLELKTIPT